MDFYEVQKQLNIIIDYVVNKVTNNNHISLQHEKYDEYMDEILEEIKIKVSKYKNLKNHIDLESIRYKKQYPQTIITLDIKPCK